MSTKALEILSGIAWTAFCAGAYQLSSYAGAPYGLVIAILALSVGLLIAVTTVCNLFVLLVSFLAKKGVAITKMATQWLKPVVAIVPGNGFILAAIHVVVSRPVVWTLRLIFGGVFLKIVLPVAVVIAVVILVPQHFISTIPEIEWASKLFELWSLFEF